MTDTLIGDTLYGGTDGDHVGYIYDDDRSHVVVGDNAPLGNCVCGRGGNDTVLGAPGGADGFIDVLSGDQGDDVLLVYETEDWVFEGWGTGGVWGGHDTVISKIFDYALETDNSQSYVEDMILGYNEYTGAYAVSGTANQLDNLMTGNIIANSLAGWTGDDTLDGDKAADVLTGDIGNDVYLYYRGDGSDIIREYGTYNAATGEDTADTLYFADLKSNEVTSARSGNDLVFTVISDGSRIRLEGFYADPAKRVEFAKFSDGTIIDIGTNHAPTAPVIANQTATEDSLFTFTAPAFSDPDQGDVLTYSASGYPSWLTFNAATRTFSGTPTNSNQAGQSTITITATDKSGASTPASFKLTVNAVNDAPTCDNPIPNQVATKGASFTYTIPAGTFSDEEDAVLTYSVSGMPQGISFNAATRTFSGTPTAGGTSAITVTAKDSGGKTATDTFNLSVTTPGNDAPVLVTAIPDQTATENSSFSYQIPLGTFTDEEDGNNLTYSVGSLPAGITFDAATRTFSGIPTVDGATSITVKATDSGGKSATDTFVISVTDSFNDAPVLDHSIADQNATEDALFSFTVPAGTFTDEEDSTLSFSARKEDGSDLPSWLTFNAATQTFSGTPLNGDVGTVFIIVTAKDSGDKTVTDTFNITVANVNDAPTVANPIADQNGREDKFFTFTVPTVTFSDVDAGDVLTYSAGMADGSDLPSWLSFDAATSTFSGTPLDLDGDKTLNIAVTAIDIAGTSAVDTFYLNLKDNLIQGTDGNDTLPGTEDPDDIQGLGGDDSLQGGNGNDTLNGGSGDDTLAGGAGDYVYIINDGGSTQVPNPDGSGFRLVFFSDAIKENANGGMDTVISSVDFKLGANLERLILTGTSDLIGRGNSFNNYISGNDGSNNLSGGGGIDTLIGGKGNDLYYVDTATDVIIELEGEGTDTIDSTVTYTLGANIENLTLDSSVLNGQINGTGNSLDNYILGNSLDNELRGLGGNDILNGSLGSDTYLFGEADGIDTIIEASNSGTDQDMIKLEQSQTTDPVLVKDNGSLYVFLDSNNYINITSQFQTATSGIERIEISDGQYITRSDIDTIINAMSDINDNTGMDLMQKFNAMHDDARYWSELAPLWK